MFIVVTLRVVVLQVADQNGIWLIRLNMSGSEKLTDYANGLIYLRACVFLLSTTL